MTVTVTDETKIRVAKAGPVRTFGDYDKRQEMDDDELISLFDAAWSKGLEAALVRSLPCEFKVAHARLKEKQRLYLDRSQEQRQFRYQEMEFLAQLDSASDDEREMTQLWKVQSGDDHPKTLFVTFETVAERQRFREIAKRLGWHDEQLGLSLVLDFMAKCENLVPREQS